MIAGLLLTLSQGWAAPPPIVNGETTADYPAVGALTAAIYGETYAYCSGTLIRDDFVLTAAHCVEAGLLYESYGMDMEFLISSDVSDESATPERVSVQAFYQHPDYNPETLESDLGLVKLAEPLETAPYPMLEQAPDNTWYGENLRLVGFGITGDDRSDTGVKRTVELPVTYIEADYIWTYDESGENACSGDSGGAALRDLGGGQYELAGVISFVYAFEPDQLPCSEGGTGLARIDNRMDWIQDVLADSAVPDETTDLEPRDTGGADGPTGSAGSTHFVEQDTSGCEASTVPGRRGGAAVLTLALLVFCRRRSRCG